MLKTGDLLRGRFIIHAPIGAGSSGIVYLAWDLKSPRVQIALKELSLGSLSPEETGESLSLFEREKNILKSLSHPGLPAYIDSFQTVSSRYLVMEYIHGETLDAIMKRRHLSWREVFLWACQLAKILDYLHTRRPDPVIYRDLKPSNIMLAGGGRLKLVDFGIARHFRRARTRDTYFMGTPGFSAPEQYGSGQSDARTDIFSFGATLYHLLSRQDMAGLQFRFPGLGKYNRQIPPFFEAIIMRCIALNPGERYQSAAGLLDDLEKGIAAHNAPKKRISLRFPTFYEILFIIAILAILAVFLAPNFLKARTNGCLTSCKSNLKNIGTALEMYSTDNHCKYPRRLFQVTPYLKFIPTCGTAGTQTYVYVCSKDQNCYTVYCKGTYHSTITNKANFPQYDSIQGLIE